MDVEDCVAVIPEAARPVIVSIVRDGYAKSDDRYSEADGSNGHTYGTDLYYMTWNGLATSPQLAELGFTFAEAMGRKRLLIGSAGVVACHRLAAYVPPNILSEVAAAPQISRRRAQQLGLPFPGHEEDDRFDSTCTLVIAHYGNHEDGCLGIYLQVPATGVARDGSWAAAQKLWLPGDELPPGGADLEPGVRVAAEAVASPTVRRKRREQA